MSIGHNSNEFFVKFETLLSLLSYGNKIFLPIKRILCCEQQCSSKYLLNHLKSY